MNFETYWARLSPIEKKLLAQDAGTSMNYLSQVANGHRSAGIKLVSKLTNIRPDITPVMLRPDVFNAA